ncbi:aldehyde dehydrogenase family protein [Ruania rhizosphaerae]|uniref:aldehyde dehydrogenase family protein n=1 Tax=Ruania rhizosphaerae TaxID=1840413 RepID=UPI00135B9D46|nr:aldehyde dehydrogenase family protein [Ruania rhizosphaerae]
MSITTAPDPLRTLIDGTWVAGDLGTLDSVNPADARDVVARVPALSAAQATAAVTAAARALPSWRATSSIDRGKVLFAAAAGIRDRAGELRDLIVREMGKSPAEATIEVERSAEMLEFNAGLARLPYGDVIPDRRPEVSAWTTHEPIGVVLAITPWNDPLMVPCRKLGPALVLGNTAVLKPSPDTPAVALVLAEIFAAAGLPDGVVNVVTGDVTEVGDALVNDLRIAGITFTGSTATGHHLSHAVAGRPTRLQTEMGGKNSAVIMSDADVTASLEALIPAIFGQTGQRCTAVSRLLVHSSRVAEVEAQLAERARAIGLGHQGEGTTIGPVVNDRQLQKVLGMIGTAEQEGATIAVGGDRPIDGDLGMGCYVTPTVLTSVTTQMRIWSEEVFGPVVAVVAFDELDQAIEMVNDTEYGLAAGIFTKDLATAHRFVERVDAGQVVINLPPSGWDVHQPFGGFKESGSPFKEHGLDGLAFYRRIKTAAMNIAH